ncbi:MAG: OmpA family protein [Bacteroidota bacterium]
MPSDVAPTDVPSPAQAASAAALPAGASPPARAPLPADRARLRELRQLLLGEGQAAFLDRWRQFAEEKVDADLLSDVLPDAVRLRSRLDAERGDSALGDALAPAIEEGIQASVARNPQPLVDAIFPIIGPAIRRAIQQALASSLQSVNQAVEYGLTWRGLRWRVEAWRSGLSIGEVALRDTLRYRVEQVFLIHTETSLLLRHAALPGLADAEDDADLVSGMLSAVQTFVRDSFHVDDTEALDALQMGDLTVWLVPGPEAVLAAVIRGTPPQELRLLLTEGIETLHRRHARDLAAFSGNVDPFEAADPVLYDLLVEQRKQDASVSPMAWVLVALLALLVGWWGWTTFDRMQRWQATLADLDALDGLDVITEERTWGAYRLVGLRDPDAPLPDSVLARHGFAAQVLADSLDANAVRMRWLPYQSDAPSIVSARAARMLDAPSTVAFTMRGDTLVGAGIAARPWIISLPEALRFVPNVRALDVTGVQTRTAAAALPVEAASIRFATDDALAPGQDAALDALVADVRALAEATVDDAQPIVLSIIGHTDGTGSAARNQRLSLRRAAVVRDALAPVLAEAGLSDRVALRLVAARDAFRLEEGASLPSRRVTFDVETVPITET